MKKVFIFICFALSLNFLVAQNPIDINEAPYHVVVKYQGNVISSGIILNNNWILTSAATVEGKNANLLSIEAGVSNSTEFGTGFVSTVAGYIAYPSYSSYVSYDHNIALLQLTGSLRYSGSIQPIELSEIITNPGQQMELSALTLLGGYLGFVEGITTVISDEQANEIYPEISLPLSFAYHIPTLGMSPANAVTTLHCGALVNENGKLCGLTNIGITGGGIVNYNYPVYNVDLYEYYNWINNYINSRGLTSINEESISELSVYPNPANNEISINKSGNVKIMDASGKLVMSITNNPKDQKIDISGFEPGVYIIQSSDKTTKLIKD